VNAFVSMWQHPPKGGMADVKWQFWAGIVLAAVGGGLVALFKPDAPSPPPAGAPHGAAVAQTAPAGEPLAKH
jgi:hypothetical protein